MSEENTKHKMIVRRSLRLLRAVHELHKQGYQNLAVFTGIAPSGFYWRLELIPHNLLICDTEGNLDSLQVYHPSNPIHSSGTSGNQYFNWKDGSTATVVELAELIKHRYSTFLAKCVGYNFEYAGWYVTMLGIAEKGDLPVMYQDYYRVSRTHILTTGQSKVPMPPIAHRAS